MSGQGCNEAVSFANRAWRTALTHATACASNVRLFAFLPGDANVFLHEEMKLAGVF